MFLFGRAAVAPSDSAAPVPIERISKLSSPFNLLCEFVASGSGWIRATENQIDDRPFWCFGDTFVYGVKFWPWSEMT